MGRNKTRISEIVDYWASRIDECDLSIDWSEAEEYCWNCGSPKELTRCHIVAHALGGEDKPNNYVVLCRHCHEEAPNVGDPRIMWDWLIAHKSSFYQTAWIVEGLREYEFIYKRTVEEEILFLFEDQENIGNEISAIFNKVIKDAVSCSIKHFGHSSPNQATVAGILRMSLLDYAKTIGKTLPDARPETLTPRKYLS